MKIKPLLEEFENYIKGINNTPVAIYKFPLSNKEIKEMTTSESMYKRYRFLVDTNKKIVYIWNGVEAIHGNIFMHFGIRETGFFNRYFSGTAVYDEEKNSFNFLNSDKTSLYIDNGPNRKETINAIKKLNLEFVDKYISGVSEYARNLK
jgi:hypothetical protein